MSSFNPGQRSLRCSWCPTRKLWVPSSPPQIPFKSHPNAQPASLPASPHNAHNTPASPGVPHPHIRISVPRQIATWVPPVAPRSTASSLPRLRTPTPGRRPGPTPPSSPPAPHPSPPARPLPGPQRPWATVNGRSVGRPAGRRAPSPWFTSRRACVKDGSRSLSPPSAPAGTSLHAAGRPPGTRTPGGRRRRRRPRNFDSARAPGGGTRAGRRGGAARGAAEPSRAVGPGTAAAAEAVAAAAARGGNRPRSPGPRGLAADGPALAAAASQTRDSAPRHGPERSGGPPGRAGGAPANWTQSSASPASQRRRGAQHEFARRAPPRAL